MPASTTDSVLARLVSAGGFLPPEAVDDALSQAAREGVPLRDVLVRRGVPAEVLGALELAARTASSTSAAKPPTSHAETILNSTRPGQVAEPSAAAMPPSDPTVIQGSNASGGRTVVAPSGTDVVPPRRQGRLTHIGKYEIVGEIGRGGMGVVYKARHPGLDRTIAVKTLINPGSPEHVERFLREARAAARMGKHPNLVQVHDVGDEGGTYYFTMEFVEGRGFEREIFEDRPAPERVAEVVEQVARGLAHAHAEGVIHRDLKPSNVLIDATRRPLVTDFGLAKEVGSGSSVSVAGQVLGTPAYMSPEQAEGHLDRVNEKSDVYGLGCVLYEGLARKAPFEGQGNVEILRRVCSQEPAAPSRLNPAVPRDLEVICLKAMSKRPEDRYESAAALADDLKRFLDGDPIHARPIPWTVRVLRKARKNAVLTAMGAAAAILLVAGSALAVKLSREKADKERQRQKAEQERLAREEENRKSDARRRLVEDAVRRGREALEKGERARRPDVAALSGAGAERETFEAATTAFREALELDQANVDALRLRPRALRLAGRQADAAAEATRGLEALPGDAALLTERVFATLDLLRHAMGNLSVVNVPGLAALGADTHRRTWINQRPEAAKLREQAKADIQALEGRGSGAAAHFFKGSLLALDETANDEAALAEFEAAIEAERTLVEAWRNKAFVLKRLGRGEAIEAYRSLAKAQPYDAEIQVELAFVELWFVRDGPAALRASDAAVKIAPDSAWVLSQRGLVHYFCDQADNAERDFRRALEIEPGHAGSLYGLFAVYEERGAYEDADDAVARWTKVAPAEPFLWWEVGAYYRVTFRHDLALPCFERAVELDPAHPLYLWARGRSRCVLGQYESGSKDMFDAVGKGDLDGNARKLYDGMRKNLEKQVANCKEPQDAAKLVEGLAGFLRLALNMSGDPERKKQYESSIGNLMLLASELYEQALWLDKAEAAYNNVPDKPTAFWGHFYKLARYAARGGDTTKTWALLREAKARGMTSLGAAKVDPGFQKIRESPEWAIFLDEFYGP